MTKGHPLKGCLFYFPNFFSLIEFFYIWKYENHPRGNSLTVAKAACPPHTPPLGHACGGVGECAGWIKPKEPVIRIESLVLFFMQKALNNTGQNAHH